MSRKLKELLTREFSQRLGDVQDALLVDVIGLDANQSVILRRQLREKNLIRGEGGRVPRVTVHTIGFHSRHGQRVLQRIAKEHGGRYVFVPPPELANVTRNGG